MCAVDAFRSMLGGLIESGMENPLERQAKFDEHMGQVQENIRVTYVLGPATLSSSFWRRAHRFPFASRACCPNPNLRRTVR